jgi:hypothetical protein
MRKHFFYTLAATMAIAVNTLAQSDFKTIPLHDLSAFENQAGNWRIVGDVMMDRNIDVHPPEAPKTATPETKKGKKSKKETPYRGQWHIVKHE